MKSKIYFLAVILLSGLLTSSLSAQCDLFESGSGPIFDCNNGGTVNDASDDTYMVDISAVNFDNGSTWTETFGPFPVATAPTVTVTDPLNTSCTLNVLVVDPPTICVEPLPCPDFDLCYEIFDNTNCSITYAVTLDGDLEDHEIGPIDLSWSANGGVIESIIFANGIDNPLSLGLVSINGNSATGGFEMKGLDIINVTPHFYITIGTDPDGCATLDDGTLRLAATNVIGSCISNETLCGDPAEFCATGVEVSGNVTAPGDIYDCPDTENHGIEGAQISITSPSGESCSPITANDGTYSCLLCDEGPYEICVDTKCPKPCGLTDLDLVLMVRSIIGLKDFTHENWILADLNGDGRVSGSDVVMLRKILLGIGPIPDINWCKFVPVEDLEKLNPLPVVGSNTSQYAAIDNCVSVTDPSVSMDFVRLMVGDMDGSCTDCIHGDEMGDLPIVIGNGEVNKFNKIVSPTKDIIHALTFHVNIPKGTEVVNIISPLPNFDYSIHDDEIHFIWADISKDNVGFNSKLNQPIVEIETSRAVELQLTGGENYLLGERTELHQLTNRKEIKSRSNDAATQQLIINGNSYIDIDQISGLGNISFIDTYGRIIHTKNIDEYSNQLEIDLPLGVYIIHIEDEVRSQTYKTFIQ